MARDFDFIILSKILDLINLNTGPGPSADKTNASPPPDPSQSAPVNLSPFVVQNPNITSFAESRSDISYIGRSKPNAEHRIVIAVKHSNLDKLEEFVNDVSNPLSPNFGQHKSREEIAALTNHHHSADLIMKYLREHVPICKIESSLYGDFITGNQIVTFRITDIIFLFRC